MNVCIIIPARLNSTRLPNKPLVDICGKPMIIHTAEQAKLSNVGDVYVAVSELEVKNTVERYGFNAIMTDPNLPSGTDRVHAAYQKLDACYDYIINLQGDCPLIDTSIIKNVLYPFKLFDECDISTVVRRITDQNEAENSNIVKAILSLKERDVGKALYFTRAKAPYNSNFFYHHFGIYAYKHDTLEQFISLKPSLLERQENLEQLRALENDMNIYCYLTGLDNISVDLFEQLEQVRTIISQRQNKH